MRLIWHIIAKDLRGHRWAILAWALLFVIQVVLGLVLLDDHGGDEDWPAYIQTANNCLVGLQFAVGYLLVAGFVQEDEVLGTRMFWATRPISPGRLLAAKALGVLLVFGLGPVLVLVPWWLWCGFTMRDLAWTAIETLGWQLVLIAPAFLLASLCDTLGRVVMWTLVLVAGLTMWLTYLYSKTKFSWVGPNGVGPDLLWLAGFGLMICAASVAIHQFLTRQHTRSIMLAVPAIVLVPVLALGAVWLRFDWPRVVANLYQPLPPTGNDWKQVRVSFASAQVRDAYGGGKNGYTGFDQSLQVEGLPPDLHIRAMIREHKWIWSGESPSEKVRGSFSLWGSTSYAALRKLFSLPEPSTDPETARWMEERRAKENARRQAMNADRVARGLPSLVRYIPRPLDGDGAFLRGYVTLDNPVARQVQSDPPAYTAQLEVLLTKPEITLEIPLKTGLATSAHSHFVRVLEATRLPDGTPESKVDRARVRLIKTNPALLKDGVWFSALTNRIDGLNGVDRMWVTVNRATGTFDITRGEGKPPSLRVGGVVINWEVLTVRPGVVVRNDRWVARDPDWFEHTTLAFVPFRPVARFTREVKTQRYELEPSELEKEEAEKARQKSSGSF